MNKFRLMSGSAAVALLTLSASGAALAQTNEITGNVGQNALNTTTVYLTDTSSVSVGNITGVGGSAGTSAIGAQSAISDQFINDVQNVVVGGNVTQSAQQDFFEQIGTQITVGVENAAGLTVGNISGAGASASRSSAGAVSSVTVNHINAGGQVTFANITQTSNNNSRTETIKDVNGTSVVANGGPGASILLSGTGSSLSVSSTGAASSVGIVGIGSNSGQSLDNVEVGNVRQDTDNTASVATLGREVVVGLSGISGAGASASLGATGAASSVGVTRIGGTSDTTRTTIGNVTQTTDNTFNRGSTINNFSSFVGSGSGQSGLTENISGNGASISSSATGAASAISIASINTAGTSDVRVASEGTISQTTNNSRGVSNTSTMPGDGTTAITGHGASASISASGAVSSISVTNINSAANSRSSVGGTSITQTTTNSSTVSNSNRFISPAGGIIELANVSGSGAAASISASGATSAIAFTSIRNTGNSPGNPRIDVGRVTQSATNTGRSVTNNAIPSRRDLPANINVASISGLGASASISSFGAASQLSVASIGDNVAAGARVGAVTQTSTNDAEVFNFGIITGTGNISGHGASASVSAVGASSQIAVSRINTATVANATSIASANQRATNNTTGIITNLGNITVGDITGNGASASISATGASAQLSIARINTTTVQNATVTGNVTQNATNNAPISNTGVISAGNITGAGAAATIGATGASAVVSVSSIN